MLRAASQGMDTSSGAMQSSDDEAPVACPAMRDLTLGDVSGGVDIRRDYLARHFDKHHIYAFLYWFPLALLRTPCQTANRDPDQAPYSALWVPMVSPWKGGVRVVTSKNKPVRMMGDEVMNVKKKSRCEIIIFCALYSIPTVVVGQDTHMARHVLVKEYARSCLRIS